jgi:hypothetical protein
VHSVWVPSLGGQAALLLAVLTDVIAGAFVGMPHRPTSSPGLGGSPMQAFDPSEVSKAFYSLAVSNHHTGPATESPSHGSQMA